MSTLNLVPNPSVMLFQAGLFIANFVAIKKLLLEPYLSVYDKRQNLTLGNKSEAAELVQKNANAMEEIKERLRDASNEASTIREKLTNEANAKKDALISEAERIAKETVQSAQVQIKESLGKESQKVPQLIDELTAVIVQQVLKA